MLIRNARVVTRDEVFTGVVRVEDGKISDVERGTTAAREAEDWEGDYLLPGLIELHTDNLEKHLVPRPGVQWNTDAAFVIHDAQVAAAGITTVFDSLAIGSRSNVGLRGRELQTQCAEALTRFSERQLLRAEHFLHLRCEIATADVVEVFDSLCAHPLLRLASVMDHTPGQRQWHDREQWRRYQERNGKLSDEHVTTALAELADEQQRYADVHRHAIVARCKSLGVPVASHDDTLVEHVEQAAAEGIVLAEFPTTRSAAEAAREHRVRPTSCEAVRTRAMCPRWNSPRRICSTSCRPTMCRPAC
jgi:alpha-D-ribose 1-methylphosphonate 5-triphosphate diphosphatase